jgi:hypothetical protein
VTGTFLTGSSPLLLSPAVTAIRSWPENVDRANVTEGTARFATSDDATETVLSVVPSGK